MKGLLILVILALVNAQTRPGVCSDFVKVWKNYPGYDKVPSDELLEQLGGDMSWMSNTCAIRTTMALNSIKVRPGDICNARWKDEKRRKYVIRVKAMTRFLRATYGAPAWTGKGVKTEALDEEGNNIYKHPESIKGKAGIIHYHDCDFSDASGHYDVWDGYRVKGHDQLRRCKTFDLYNICNPVESPDYSGVWKHMKDTNAWDRHMEPVLNGSGSRPAPRNGRRAPGGPGSKAKKAQELLNQLSSRLNNPKLNSGVADGIIGPITRRALRNFQKLAGIRVSGYLTEETFLALEKY